MATSSEKSLFDPITPKNEPEELDFLVNLWAELLECENDEERTELEERLNEALETSAFGNLIRVQILDREKNHERKCLSYVKGLISSGLLEEIQNECYSINK